MSKETSDEPYWMPRLIKILEETKKHLTETDIAFFRLKNKMAKFPEMHDAETREQIGTVSTFVAYFPAGGATVHDLLMFLDEHVL